MSRRATLKKTLQDVVTFFQEQDARADARVRTLIESLHQLIGQASTGHLVEQDAKVQTLIESQMVDIYVPTNREDAPLYKDAVHTIEKQLKEQLEIEVRAQSISKKIPTDRGCAAIVLFPILRGQDKREDVIDMEKVQQIDKVYGLDRVASVEFFDETYESYLVSISHMEKDSGQFYLTYDVNGLHRFQIKVDKDDDVKTYAYVLSTSNRLYMDMLLDYIQNICQNKGM
jgi:hypothetical protein